MKKLLIAALILTVAYAAGVSQTQPIHLAKVQRDSNGNRVDHTV